MTCQIVGRLYQTLDHIDRKEKTPRDLAGFESLNKADIRLIDMVALSPGASASELSQILGVTPGAMSQWCRRLEKMGIIERVPLEGNRKEKQIFLTPEGEEIKAERDSAHRAANAQMCSFLRGLEPDQLEAIVLFLNQAMTLDISPFECLSDACTLNQTGAKNA